MIFANYHTHTTFCDGRDTPEQLVQEAIRLGCPALGFSGHSYAFYDAACMPKENIRPYQAEIRRLQSAYSGQIRILLGIEQEYYSDKPTEAYDYVIGAVHNLRHGSEYRSVDHTRERLIAIVDDWFGGDWYAMVEEYYRLVGDLYEKTHCRVIAHFDLIEKFNEAGFVDINTASIVFPIPVGILSCESTENLIKRFNVLRHRKIHLLDPVFAENNITTSNWTFSIQAIQFTVNHQILVDCRIKIGQSRKLREKFGCQFPEYAGTLCFEHGRLTSLIASIKHHRHIARCQCQQYFLIIA